MPPDIVYVVRPGDANDELRYSLRSLVNLPHGRVWVAGYAPKWLAPTVGRIPVDQSPNAKQANAAANLRAALTYPGVSSRIVLMNDDFYVMQPLDRMPVLHWGPLDAVIATHRPGVYRDSMVATRDLLLSLGVAEPLSYELHVPFPVRSRRKLLEAMDRGAHIHGLQWRTLYANLERLGGEYMADVKVYSLRTKWSEGARFLSTLDSTFHRNPVGRYIRSRFPQPGPYEIHR